MVVLNLLPAKRLPIAPPRFMIEIMAPCKDKIRMTTIKALHLTRAILSSSFKCDVSVQLEFAELFPISKYSR